MTELSLIGELATTQTVRGTGSRAVLDTPLIIRDMPRPGRAAEGGLIYHALNRANARLAVFQTDEHYAAFQRALAEAVVRHHMRLLAYCLMSSHFHVLLWPREDGDSSRFMSWLTMTHTQRWHAHHRTAGTGHLDQGRFESFPRAIGRAFPHGVPLCRAERLAGQLGGACRGLAVGGLGVPRTKDDADRPALNRWPIDRPRDWTDRVNRSFGPKKRKKRCDEAFSGVNRPVRRPGRPRLRNDWGWSRCFAPEAVRERSLRTDPDPFYLISRLTLTGLDWRPLTLKPLKWEIHESSHFSA